MLDRRSSCALLFACLLGLLLPSCASGGREPDPVWRTAEVEAASEHILWIFSLDSLDRMGYPLGSEVNPSELTVRTGWRTSLAPFRGDGRRYFADMKVEPRGMKRWEVAVRVATQANMALSNPLDPRYAEWEWRADDTRQADILLQAIRSSIQAPLEMNSESGS